MGAANAAGPYQSTAKGYVARGWLGALPLPPREKSPVPKGYTGKQHWDVEPTSADIERWSTSSDALNIGLRMPRGILGIDVDAYGDKPGAASLAAAEAKWGPLPATWISTSRNDGVSGIRFYRTPEGLKWPNTVGPGIETVHRGHRYAVVWPSMHPDGRQYQWVTPAGQFSGWDIPWAERLPLLPDSWIEGLTHGEMADGPSARAKVDQSVVSNWKTAGAPCRLVQAKLDQSLDAVGSAGSRHDAARDLSLSLLYLGQQGHAGVGLAIDLLGDAFVDAVSKDRPRDAEFEWSTILAGAGEIVAGSPRKPETCTGEDCTGAILRPVEGLPVITPPSELQAAQRAVLSATTDALWDARPELAHIRQAARSRRASPWAVLGCVLVRVVCQVGPQVVLPPLRGSDASLNLFVGLVGKSGDGKGAAEGVASDLVRYGDPQVTANVGSGEGLVHSYLRYVPPKKDEPASIEQHTHSVLFRASEVDTLAALKNRTGSTLLPALRDAWIGDTIGFAYATAEKRLMLNAHTYRMGLIVGVQPERSGTLLDDADGGTPQRFLWLPANDPDAPATKLREPDVWQWRRPSISELMNNGSRLGRLRLPVCATARNEIDSASLARLRGDGEALDGHALLSRLKVAAALGILNGRFSVTDEDWLLAGLVMDQSNATRAEQQAALRSVAMRSTEKRAEREVLLQERVEESKERRANSRIQKGLLTKIEAASDPVPLGELKRRTKAAERSLVEDALDQLVVAGLVVSEEFEYHGKKGTRYRPAGARK